MKRRKRRKKYELAIVTETKAWEASPQSPFGRSIHPMKEAVNLLEIKDGERLKVSVDVENRRILYRL